MELVAYLERRKLGRRLAPLNPLDAPSRLRPREFAPGSFPRVPPAASITRRSAQRPAIPAARLTRLSDPDFGAARVPAWRRLTPPGELLARRNRRLPSVQDSPGRLLAPGVLGGTNRPWRGTLAPLIGLDDVDSRLSAGSVKNKDRRRRELARMVWRRSKPKVTLGTLDPPALAHAQGRTAMQAPAWLRSNSHLFGRARSYIGQEYMKTVAPQEVTADLATGRVAVSIGMDGPSRTPMSSALEPGFPDEAAPAAIATSEGESPAPGSGGLFLVGAMVLGFMVLRRAA